MTLAYQYPTEQHESLLKLAKDIDTSADVQWDFRLYSRDIRVGQTEVCIVRLYSRDIRVG
jgi:hypothetical protein